MNLYEEVSIQNNDTKTFTVDCTRLCNLTKTEHDDCVRFSLANDQETLLPFTATLWVLLIMVFLEAILEKCCSFMPIRKSIEKEDV